jgi:uncharacterized protein YbjT (DUF2867 family)
LPMFPMFGRGDTALQPVYVEDVAEAIACTFDTSQNVTYELGGPRAYRYKDLLRVLRDQLRARIIFVPVPFAVWRSLAGLAELLPRPTITRGQVELMQIDTVSNHVFPGFANLGIRPRELEVVLASMLGRHQH